MSTNQNKNQLPEGWKWVKLGDVFSVSSGKGIKVRNLSEGKYPVYGGNGLNGYHSEYFLTEPKLIIGRVGVKCGVLHITKPKSWVTDNALIIEPLSEDFDIRFLQLKLTYENLNKLSVSTAQPVLSGSKIKDYKIQLPPLPTQQLIVSKIESLFTQLDKGIESLRLAQQQLKIYRQAVLKLAFEGRLTNDDVKDGELPEEWKWVNLGEFAKISGGITKNSKRENYELVLPYLRVANVYFNKLDLQNIHTIGIRKSELERVKLVKDDLLFVEGNGSIDQIGRVALWDGSIAQCVHQNHLIKARFSKYVLPKYALFFFSSKIGRNKIERLANSTSGLHTLNLTKISKLPIPICSTSEQHQIIQAIESRLIIADNIEQTINQSLTHAEALKQSILKMAFEGRLM